MRRMTPLKRTELKRGARIRPARKVDPAKECKKLCRRLVVELRDGNACQRCCMPGTASKIDWAHIKNRGAKSLVCVPWASLALCAGCHIWFDQHKSSQANPGDGMKWWMEAFPDRALRLRAWEHNRSRPKINYALEKLYLVAEIAKHK